MWRARSLWARSPLFLRWSDARRSPSTEVLSPSLPPGRFPPEAAMTDRHPREILRSILQHLNDIADVLSAINVVAKLLNEQIEIVRGRRYGASPACNRQGVR